MAKKSFADEGDAASSTRVLSPSRSTGGAQDIDDVYMLVCLALTGRGGGP
jgi:hypothetical protein